MGGICREVIENRLVITDVDEDILEDAHARVLIQRRQHPALGHILDYADRLETYRFSTGIRTGNDQNTFRRGQAYVERHDLLPFCPQR